MYKLVIIFLIFASCQTNMDTKKVVVIPIEKDLELDSSIIETELLAKISSIYKSIDLVNLQDVNDQILIDVKYASTDNFMGIQLYDSISVIYLNKEVAERLSLCQSYLDSIRPDFRLLVYDGVRPLEVQKEMWNALDSIPVYRRGRFVSNPSRGSVHNYGAAVDLTIVDSQGNVLDMGAGYDDSRKIAYPSLERKFLASGELSQEQLSNRKLLRKVMQNQDFRNIPSEWWHFNAYSRVTTSRKYKRLLNESGKSDSMRLFYPKKDTLSNLQEN